MIRFSLWLVATVMLGISVHLASLLVLPRFAVRTAFGKAEKLGPENTFHTVPRSSPEESMLPFPDPSILAAMCRYDLSKGPVQVSVPMTGAFLSVSFYTPNALNYYAINDRAATKGVIGLTLFTPRQLAEIRSREGPDTPETLRVESPSDKGLILIRALIPAPSQAGSIEARVKMAACAAQ